MKLKSEVAKEKSPAQNRMKSVGFGIHLDLEFTWPTDASTRVRIRVHNILYLVMYCIKLIVFFKEIKSIKKSKHRRIN